MSREEDMINVATNRALLNCSISYTRLIDSKKKIYTHIEFAIIMLNLDKSKMIAVDTITGSSGRHTVW
jgi:hypothetical protein